MLNLHVNPNPLTLSERTHGQVPILWGDTVSSIAWRHLDVRWLLPQMRVMAVLNGRRLPFDELRVPVMPGDDLTFVQLPQAPVIAFVGSTAFLTALAASAAVSLVTGVISYLLMRNQARQQRGDDESPTYSWDGIDNAWGAGNPIGVLYGEMRTGLQVLQSFRMANRYGGPQLSTLAGDKINLLFLISEGPVESIGALDNGTFPPQAGFNEVTAYDANTNPTGIQSVKVNSNALTTNLLPQALFSGRFGYLQQDPIPGFHNTRIEYSVNEGFEVPPQSADSRINLPVSVTPNGTELLLPVDSTRGFFPNDVIVVAPGTAQERNYTIRRTCPRQDIILQGASTTTTATINPTDLTFPVADTSGFATNDFIILDSGLPTEERHIITVVDSTHLAVSGTGFAFSHASGTQVYRLISIVVTDPFLSQSYALDTQVLRQGNPTIKYVVYQTTAQSQKLTTSDSDKAIVIRLRFEALFVDNGSGVGSKTVQFAVQDRFTGAAVLSSPTMFAITDRRRGQFFVELAYKPAHLQRHDDRTLDIIISRLTPLDGTSSASTCFVDSIIEVSDNNSALPDQPDKFGYPGCATLAMTLIATEQFSGGPPTVTLVCKGRRCRTISGGVISTTEIYTNNPAWVVLDMLTNQRYGMGDAFADDQIDADSFEAWAAYCDEEVDNGAGGTEPRFQFDGKFDRAEPRWDAVQRAASTAWCSLVLSGRMVKAKFEYADGSIARPRVQLFTMANILRDSFELEWLNTENRPTVYNVQILNRARDYEQDSIAVLDTESRAANDPTTLTPLVARPETYRLEGVVRASQARRDAIRRHRINRLVKRKVKLGSATEAVNLEVGDRYGVQYGHMRWFGSGPTKTTLSAALSIGATQCSVLSTDRFTVGDTISLEPNTANYETAVLTDVDHVNLTLSFAALGNAHSLNGPVVNMGRGVPVTIAGSNSASGQNILTLNRTEGINANDELWMEPGTAFEERGFVQAILSSTQVRMASNLTQAHTTARAGTVVNLTAPQFTARASRDGTATSDLYLDFDVTLPTTFTAIKFVLRAKDGSIVERQFSGSPGVFAADTAIPFSGGALDYARGAPVAIGVDGQVVRDFICQSIDRDGDTLQVTIEGLEYVAEAYSDSFGGSTGAPILGDDTSDQSPETITDASTIPVAEVVSEVFAEQAQGIGARGIDVHWTRDLDDQASPSKVWWRRLTDEDSDLWRVAGETTGNFLNIADADEAGVTYEVVVTPQSPQKAYPDPGGQTPVTVTIRDRGARLPKALNRGLVVASDLGG